jgi:hypothetical protein
MLSYQCFAFGLLHLIVLVEKEITKILTTLACRSVIYANAGGPYGSEILADVQAASDSVWNSEVLAGKVGQDWYKASIQINSHPTEPWTAQAIKPDGSLGTKFTFERR